MLTERGALEAAGNAEANGRSGILLGMAPRVAGVAPMGRRIVKW